MGRSARRLLSDGGAEDPGTTGPEPCAFGARPAAAWVPPLDSAPAPASPAAVGDAAGPTADGGPAAGIDGTTPRVAWVGSPLAGETPLVPLGVCGEGPLGGVVVRGPDCWSFALASAGVPATVAEPEDTGATTGASASDASETRKAVPHALHRARRLGRSALSGGTGIRCPHPGHRTVMDPPSSGAIVAARDARHAPKPVGRGEGASPHRAGGFQAWLVEPKRCGIESSTRLREHESPAERPLPREERFDARDRPRHLSPDTPGITP